MWNNIYTLQSSNQFLLDVCDDKCKIDPGKSRAQAKKGVY